MPFGQMSTGSGKEEEPEKLFLSVASRSKTVLSRGRWAKGHLFTSGEGFSVQERSPWDEPGCSGNYYLP